MPAKAVQLDVAVVTQADVAAFDQVASSAAGMGGAVEKAADQADAAAGKLDGVAAGVENVDDKAGKATGALGALSSGFELIGAEKAAQGLQAAAMATDFASGAAQAFTLITELESVAKAKAVVTTAAQTTATVAQTTATKVAAAGQAALNAVLAANPVGLVVIAVVALVAGLVLAYQKSETFRDIVDAAFSKVKSAAENVVDIVGDVVDGVEDVIKWVKDLPEAFSGAKEKVVNSVEAMLTPIQSVIDKVQDLIGWIADIDFPDINVPGFSRAALPSNAGAGGSGWTANGFTGGSGDQGEVVRLLAAILAALTSNGSGLTDPLALGRLLRQLGLRSDRILPA